MTTRIGHLALALLLLELLAGMQSYLSQTILPLMATDLDARQHYGLVTAAGTVPSFLTMPLGGAMLNRWRTDLLMRVLTMVLVAGAVLSALSPGIGVYVAGQVIGGLAAGALATVTMGVLVEGLPETWRRLYMAIGAAMWVVSSLVGPAYAASVSTVWGWRWALVAYIPLLVLARLVAAREVTGLRVSSEKGRAPVVPALVLAAGVAALGAIPASSRVFWLASLVGLAAVVWACAQVFPPGSLRLRRGRPADIATLTWIGAAYFALDYLISPMAHDVLAMSAAQVGWALTVAGVCWSLAAMWCGAHPARATRVIRRRAVLAAALFGLGGTMVAVAIAGSVPWWWLHLGWAVAGIGMGFVHQDAVLRCVTAPEEIGRPADGIATSRIATSVTVANAAGGAVLGTLATSVVAPTEAGVEAGIAVPVVAALTVMLVMTPLLVHRSA